MLIVRSPVRISFAGGGTDLPVYFDSFGGAVLSAAINKYFYTIVAKRADGNIQIISSRNFSLGSGVLLPPQESGRCVLPLIFKAAVFWSMILFWIPTRTTPWVAPLPLRAPSGPNVNIGLQVKQERLNATRSDL